MESSKIEMKNAREIASILLEHKAVELNPDKPFTFSSGLSSPIYCDNRILISDPGARIRVCQAFLQMLEPLSFDVVCGVATAGIAWASWIAQALGKPMAYVRSSSKEHGKQNQIEGRIQKGQSVVLIEDLISTGGSSLKAAQSILDQEIDVQAIASIFTYGFASSVKLFEKQGILFIRFPT
ncbi:MAG: orotate phosphoribosyltransferase [Bdellovibrionota bacterium]